MPESIKIENIMRAVIYAHAAPLEVYEGFHQTAILTDSARNAEREQCQESKVRFTHAAKRGCSAAHMSWAAYGLPWATGLHCRPAANEAVTLADKGAQGPITWRQHIRAHPASLKLSLKLSLKNNSTEEYDGPIVLVYGGARWHLHRGSHPRLWPIVTSHGTQRRVI